MDKIDEKSFVDVVVLAWKLTMRSKEEKVGKLFLGIIIGAILMGILLRYPSIISWIP